jgi:hypothetical protein
MNILTRSRRLVAFITLCGACLLGPSPLGAEPSNDLPSHRLEPVVAEMASALMIFDRKPGEKEPTAWSVTPILRADFAGQRAVAPVQDQARLEAAIAVCDAITGALAERRAMRGKAEQAGLWLHPGTPPRGKNNWYALQTGTEWKTLKSKLLQEISNRYSYLKEAEAMAAAKK